MNRSSSTKYQATLNQIQIAEAELKELHENLRSFEAVVDAQLGDLLDQLGHLNAETSTLEAQLRQIREERLFGKDRMQYTEGAPQPPNKPNLSDLPPHGIIDREAIHGKSAGTSVRLPVPDIKALYRKLARRYHPDLMRNSADRAASNMQMVEINRAYNAGDLKSLMRIAGIGLPYGVELPEDPNGIQKNHSELLSEQELADRKLKAIRQQITRMSDLPIIKLSLEVKLAQHQGRNLLREMAADLQYKVGRKLAERDYLHAQIKTNLGDVNS
jgi:DnaJ domain